MDEIRFRIRESPTGGSRIAYSYLAGVMIVVIVGFAATILGPIFNPFGETGVDIDQRALALLLVGLGASGLIADAAGAAVFRLGWEWWAVMAAFIVSLPLWSTALPLEMLWTPFLGAPLAAALATLGGPRRPAWRPWVIGGLFAALVVATALVTFVL